MVQVRATKSVISEQSSVLEQTNPIFPRGTIVVEYDTKKCKISDGITPWASLPYIGSDSSMYVQAPSGGVTERAVAIFTDSSGRYIDQSSPPVTVDEYGNVNILAGRTYNIEGSPHTHNALIDENTGYTAAFGIAYTDGIAYLELRSGATGLDPSIRVTGSSNDIGINIVTKGSGNIKFNGTSVSSLFTSPSHNHTGGNGAAITESAMSLSDVTTLNVSTSSHGFCPKAPDDTTKFLRGDGTWNTVDADTLDGQHATAFASSGHNHDSVYLSITGTALDSDKLDGQHASAFAAASHTHSGSEITSAVSNAVDADTLDGYHASQFAQASHSHSLSDITVDTTLRVCPHVDFHAIHSTSKPQLTRVGLVNGFTLPIYNNDSEELFFTCNVPQVWDGSSDITLGFVAALDSANTDKKFALQMDWQSITPGDVLSSSTVSASSEISVTGAASQYQTYDVSMTIDYDYNTPDVIEAGDTLVVRLRRISASSDEITGNIIVYGFFMQFNRDKIGP